MPDDRLAIDELPPTSQLVVAAVVKGAFGAAIGALSALALGGFAAICAINGTQQAAHKFVWLVGNNFLPGYSPTWSGVVAGVAWGFSGGYLLGFTTALARNRLLKFLFWFEATRARLTASRTVLDDLS